MNLTKEQMAIYKDVNRGKKSSPKNIIIKSLLRDLSEAHNRYDVLSIKSCPQCAHADHDARTRLLRKLGGVE